MRKLIFCLLIGVFTLSPTKSYDDSLWNIGKVPYLGGCVKNGIQIPGLPIILPPEMDPWPLVVHCNTYNGSVGCFKEDDSVLPYGLCLCNQRNDAHPDALGTGLCLGKVGAYCTAEHHSLFPDKLCTENAYCKPVQDGVGRTVGRCQCLYGYDANSEGRCKMNFAIPDPERSTTPPTTTSTAPPKEAIKLPSLDLLIGINFVNLESECNSKALLNKTFCSTYGGTVGCLKGNELGERSKCQCNMQTDSVFDEELNMCVGKEGAYCLARWYILGYRACVKNADCMTEDGTSYDDGYSFGRCECLYGYERDGKGNCVRDKDISRPSTKRPIGIQTTTNSGSTEDGSSTTPDDKESSSSISGGSGGGLIFLVMIYFSLNFVF